MRAEETVDAVALRAITDLAVAQWSGTDLLSPHNYPARRRYDLRGQHPERGALPCTVRPQQAETFARLDADAQVLHGHVRPVNAAVLLAQFHRLQRVVRHPTLHPHPLLGHVVVLLVRRLVRAPLPAESRDEAALDRQVGGEQHGADRREENVVQAQQLPAEGRLVSVHVELLQQLGSDVVARYLHEGVAQRVLRKHEQQVMQNFSRVLRGFRPS